MRKILIIDDDVKLIELLRPYLAGHGMEVVSATEPKAGLRLVHAARPELVVLDVMLPGMSGFEVCKQIRAASSVPIIMLTARGEVADRIVGLELGADDYLPKPFEPRELVARIQSILRRGAPAPAAARWRVDDLEVDAGARAARLGGEPVDLTTTEFNALALFVANPGRVFDRDELIDRLRAPGWEAYHRTIDVLMSRLRQKLGDDPKAPRFFKTIWGSGYMFIGRPERVEG